MRQGAAGEYYEGIGKERVNVSGRITLADREGPFGNPSSDSLRTSINLDSREVVMILFAPTDYSRQQLQNHLNLAQTVMLKYHPSGIIYSQDTLI